MKSVLLQNIILYYTSTDPIGILMFWAIVGIVTLIFYIRSQIEKSVAERKRRKLEKAFNEINELQNQALTLLGLKLQNTFPKTFPKLNFIQQRKFTHANYLNNNGNQIGKSEKEFNNYLVEYFGPGRIYWNNRQIGFKIPDFVYEDKLKNVYIAIEIDEPYIYKTKQAIHFYGSEEDLKKEQIYRLNGWTLIRFSEYQVINYPTECCLFLAQVVDYIGIEKKYSLTPKFENHIIIPLDKQWTKEEAIKMANNETRG